MGVALTLMGAVAVSLGERLDVVFGGDRGGQSEVLHFTPFVCPTTHRTHLRFQGNVFSDYRGLLPRV